MIKAIIAVLSWAYANEAKKLARNAKKLDKLHAQTAVKSVELARQSREALEEAQGIAREKHHVADRAEFFRRRGKSIVEMFGGDVQ